jgi:electron-transferring-flavoprotein dehydrogenase
MFSLRAETESNNAAPASRVHRGSSAEPVVIESPIVRGDAVLSEAAEAAEHTLSNASSNAHFGASAGGASSGRAAGRHRASGKNDRIAAVEGILEAVRTAAAEAEKAAVHTETQAVRGNRNPSVAPEPDMYAAPEETPVRMESMTPSEGRDDERLETGTGRVSFDPPPVPEPAIAVVQDVSMDATAAEIRSDREQASESPVPVETPPERAAAAETESIIGIENGLEGPETVEAQMESRSEDRAKIETGPAEHIRPGSGSLEAVSAVSEAAEKTASAPQALKRERFQTDVLIAGAGVAGLSTAIRLLQRVNAHNTAVEEGRLETVRLETPQVMVVEKAADIGNHVLSGAAVDPVSLRALFPDFENRGAPIDAWVENNPFYYLSSKAAIRVPFTPPGMGSKGCFITSLSRFTRWLASEAESLGAQTAAGFAAVDWLEAGGAVAGLRLGDKGIDKHGHPRHNAMAGDEIEARVTVLAEGVHGTLTQRALHAFGLDRDAMPQAAVLVIKEIIELPEERSAAGTALHTFGYPHDASTYAGGFLYAGPGRMVTIGLATGLDYRDPLLDPHDLFVRWKSHPLLRKRIDGGKVVEYGAKTIPEGGYFSVPRLVADGLMIVGDAGGLLNSIRLKGIHLAVQSGMDAGDALFEAWKSGEFGKSALEAYPKAFFGGWAGREMRRVRNLHQCFHGGQMAFMAGIGLHTATLGLLPAGRLMVRPDADSLTPLSKRRSGTTPFTFTPDALMPDKLSDVFLSGTVHEEDQRSHIAVLDGRVCAEKCKPEFDCPCTRFCPAQVYEWSEEEKRIRVNFTNCLHCQTCEVKDPFRNISWKLPEGGGGPKYKGM